MEKFPLAQRRVEVRNIQVIDNKLLVVQLESHIFLYVISVDHLRLSFELKGLFMFDESVKNVIAIGKGNIMITTRDCVYHYQSEEDKFNLVYENMLLQGVHYNNDTVYLITALEWDKISLSEPAISEQRFNVSGTEEVTDTFALQRLKKRKL
ncbi:uncharacterized protein KQ657_003355 [Scheffersomyces spartinae]|uniref:Uncharacterized protein n=1 Tax=Scheffersomyces spartinae TaxID=45513 RepID=A0A9P8AK88_9ASCO|nr:uncharacterized protein KQ657_003355 [Scheffersomyces spartinae]KAG7195588.1 hypothetical protein KQ657_003355 [Scheffersomyces spartinae]